MTSIGDHSRCQFAVVRLQCGGATTEASRRNGSTNSSASGEIIGLPWVTAWAFLRICTNARIWSNPLPANKRSPFWAQWWDQPDVIALQPGPRHREILERLITEHNATGPLVTDAVLAALAIENGATLASTDQDFSRFRSLRWINPLEGGRPSPQPSKIKLQSQLNLARRPLKQGRISRAGDTSRLGRPDLSIRVVELRSIEHVKCFRSKLQAPGFGCSKAEALEQGEVEFGRARTRQDVPSRSCRRRSCPARGRTRSRYRTSDRSSD